MRTKLFQTLILLFITLTGSYAQSGTLDPSFGTNGKTETSINSNDQAYASAIQSDGKIIVGGFTVDGTKTNIALVRYNYDGTLDNFFDTDGIVTTLIGQGASCTSLVIQPDGKIVIAGAATIGSFGDLL